MGRGRPNDLKRPLIFSVTSFRLNDPFYKEQVRPDDQAFADMSRTKFVVSVCRPCDLR